MLLNGGRLTTEVLDRIPRLEKVFDEHPEVRLAYLFGSAASGRMTSLSDIDIAVLLRRGLTRDSVRELQLGLVGSVGDTLKTDGFDLIVLNLVPLTLRFQVLKTGMLLHSKSETERVVFEEQVRDEYFDFMPLRDEYYRVFFRNIKQGRMLGDRHSQDPKASQQPPGLPGTPS